MDTRIVIASYKEDLEWVKSLGISYKIYCASETKREGTISVPNIAREASQYLFHIIDSYKNSDFYDYEIFSQGSYMPHIPDFCEKIKSLYYKKYDFCHLNDVVPFGYGQCPHDVFAKQFYTEWFGADNYNYRFSPGAFFSVTRKRLLGRSLHYYERLYAKVIELHYMSPWAMERLWEVII